MLTKWFIGVNAKSKGFFQGWNDGYGYYRQADLETKAKPSFTKQTALATSYDSKKDAKLALDEYRKTCTKEIKKQENKIASIIKATSNWDKQTPQQKLAFCNKHDLEIAYDAKEKQYYGKNAGTMQTVRRTLWRGYKPRFTAYGDFQPIEQKAIKDLTLDGSLELPQSRIKLNKNRLDFINNKLQIREQELEIKFMDKERREIKWLQRGENETAGDYCNCCGGAVPGIAQIQIGNGWKDRTVICAICMGKLAQEATIQMEKIPEEVLEHYETDRFVRAV
jgi:hypothetical protein